MLKRSFEGIEVYGAMLEAYVKAFRLFPTRALALLAKHGIATAKPNGELQIDYGRWYPMEAWLKAFTEIIGSVGPNVVFDVGKELSGQVDLPRDVKDIHAAIRRVDVAYHMSHRKDGRLMYQRATDTTTEGIGHYGYQARPGDRRIVSVCDNPYPCTFDHGILTTFSRKFESTALVSHSDTASCRAKGGPSCTYTITW